MPSGCYLGSFSEFKDRRLINRVVHLRLLFVTKDILGELLLPSLGEEEAARRFLVEFERGSSECSGANGPSFDRT